MASRGNSGLIILSSVLGLLAAAGLGVGLWGYTQATGLQKQYDDLKREVGDYVRDAERNNDTVRELVNEAKRNNTSLTGLLTSNFAGLAEKVSGQRSETPGSLTRKIETTLQPLGKSNLIDAVSELGGEVVKARTTIAAAEKARQESIDSLRTSQDRIRAQEEAFQSTIATLNTSVETYKTQIDGFKTTLDTRVEEMQASVDKIKRDAADEASRLNDRIARLNEELLVAQGKVRALQGTKGTASVADEAALVDGEVVALVDADNTVFINRGRSQRIALGMTFEVYGEAGQIRINEAGEYSRGKGALEIIRVDDNSAVARVIRSTRGNPVARGDVIVNPVYDPRKVYRFVVSGTFDTNGDGRSTADEADSIRALVTGWGGQIADSLAGDVDFVVTGGRPVVPPSPPSDAPAALVDQFVRARRAATDYDNLIQGAGAAGIPILNQNRLFTLMGK
jgi:gas vesicle protein